MKGYQLLGLLLMLTIIAACAPTDFCGDGNCAPNETCTLDCPSLLKSDNTPNTTTENSVTNENDQPYALTSMKPLFVDEETLVGGSLADIARLEPSWSTNDDKLESEPDSAVSNSFYSGYLWLNDDRLIIPGEVGWTTFTLDENGDFASKNVESAYMNRAEGMIAFEDRTVSSIPPSYGGDDRARFLHFVGSLEAYVNMYDTLMFPGILSNGVLTYRHKNEGVVLSNPDGSFKGELMMEVATGLDPDDPLGGQTIEETTPFHQYTDPLQQLPITVNLPDTLALLDANLLFAGPTSHTYALYTPVIQGGKNNKPPFSSWYVVDVSDIVNPEVLGRLSDYPELLEALAAKNGEGQGYSRAIFNSLQHLEDPVNNFRGGSGPSTNIAYATKSSNANSNDFDMIILYDFTDPLHPEEVERVSTPDGEKGGVIVTAKQDGKDLLFLNDLSEGRKQHLGKDHRTLYRHVVGEKGWTTYENLPAGNWVLADDGSALLVEDNSYTPTGVCDEGAETFTSDGYLKLYALGENATLLAAAPHPKAWSIPAGGHVWDKYRLPFVSSYNTQDSLLRHRQDAYDLYLAPIMSVPSGCNVGHGLASAVFRFTFSKGMTDPAAACDPVCDVPACDDHLGCII